MGGMLVTVSAFGSTLLVTGKEEFLSSRVVENRRDEALTEQPGAEVHRIQGAELAETPLAEIAGGSLFASHIITIIDDAGSIPPDEVDQVVDLARNPGEELSLTLVHDGGVKGKKLIDALKKAKIATETVAPLKQHELEGFCTGEARRLRVKLGRDAPQALVDALGGDLRTLSGAIRQLADDADGGEIDAQMIRRYFAGRAEVTSFKVVDAVLAGNSVKALEQLRWALSTGAAPVLVTSAMAGSFRGLGKYLEASSQGMQGAEMVRYMGMPSWKLRQFSAVQRSWDRAGVATAIRVIARGDAAVKGAASDADYALERMVLDVLRARRG